MAGQTGKAGSGSGSTLESHEPLIPGGLLGLDRSLLLAVVHSLLLGRPRSVAEDAELAVARMRPSPRIDGAELVPPTEPFLLVANHFQAPGLWVGWAAAAITAAVARARDAGSRQLHWMVLSEWRWFEAMGRWVPAPFTPLLFPRACRVWGMIPMPPRPSDVAGRARALRQVLAYLALRPGADSPAPEPVALFPEGRATLALEEARPGVGGLLHRVSTRGVPLLPVGVYREGPTLVVRIGPLFSLAGLSGKGDELDERAREQVMVAIGRLLPRRLWGLYAESIARADRQTPTT
jgi:hypothetical protein